MRFFFTVLLIAVATATIASNLSPQEQIGAASSFIHNVASHLKEPLREQLSAVPDLSGLLQPRADTVSAETAPEPAPSAPDVHDAEDRVSLPPQTVEIAEVPDFQEFAVHVPEVDVEESPSRRPTPSASILAEPLESDEVSEVIRRLGRVSRTAARSAVRHERRSE